MRAPVVSPTPAAAPPTPGRRLSHLDGLRGLAALAIFVYHGWLYTMHGEPAASRRSTVGDYAVHELRLALVAFFVLSGFLLYRPAVAAALGARRAPGAGRYAVARIARIAPAYYAALIGSIVLLWGMDATPGVRLPPASELPLFFVFAQNFSAASVLKLDPPMWSLTVEVCFYALIPLMAWLAIRLPARRGAQALIPIVLVAGGIAFNWAIAGDGHGMTFSKTLPAMAPYFGAGMLAALLVHERRAGAGLRRGLVFGGLALVGADALTKSLASAGAFDPGPYFDVFRDLPSGMGFALVIAALSMATVPGVLGGRVLAGLGAISYGFYLWHVPVLLALRAHGLLPLDPVLGTLVALGPALALGTLSWLAIERPAIRWAARRAARKRSARERATSGGDDARARRREIDAVRV